MEDHKEAGHGFDSDKLYRELSAYLVNHFEQLISSPSTGLHKESIERLQAELLSGLRNVSEKRLNVLKFEFVEFNIFIHKYSWARILNSSKIREF